MIKQNPSRKPAARTRSGNLLALLLPAALIPALLLLFLAGGATASAQVVTNSADSGPGTLRSAKLTPLRRAFFFFQNCPIVFVASWFSKFNRTGRATPCC